MPREGPSEVEDFSTCWWANRKGNGKSGGVKFEA